MMGGPSHSRSIWHDNTFAYIPRSQNGNTFPWALLFATCVLCLTPLAVADEGTTGSFNPATDCAVQDERRNKGLRIGSFFILLVTSSVAVFGPILLAKFPAINLTSLPFTIIRQFGTGVIISTAFVHLLTESSATFANPCIGELSYESTPTAIAIAGALLAFLIEYTGARFLYSRAELQPSVHSEDGGQGNGESGSKATEAGSESNSDAHRHGSHGFHAHGGPVVTDDNLSVLVMEAGIIAHSILIGITLVVADNSAFTTLLIVIVFHQAFEGLALGARIAALPAKDTPPLSKLLLGFAFAITTPIGIAIGLGVLNQFNGNDKHTLLALGTLDAMSAGILAWVGLVEMLAGDWLFTGEMKTAGIVKTLLGGLSLLGGLILMSLLGKWT